MVIDAEQLIVSWLNGLDALENDHLGLTALFFHSARKRLSVVDMNVVTN